MGNIPELVPIIKSPDFDDLPLPLDLETWHKRRGQLCLTIGQFCFQQFSVEDTDLIYEIRNHPSVLPFMSNSKPISYQQHTEWVRTTLLSDKRDKPLILVGRFEGQGIAFGVLKSTAIRKSLEIGVIVIDEWQNHSLSARLGAGLIAIAHQIFGAETLISYVNMHHRQALRLNAGAGLIMSETSDKPGEFCFQTLMDVVTSTRIYRRCIRDLTITIDNQIKPSQE